MYLKSLCNIEQILSRKYQYMVHSCVNGDNSTIQIAEMNIVGLENKKLYKKEYSS